MRQQEVSVSSARVPAHCNMFAEPRRLWELVLQKVPSEITEKPPTRAFSWLKPATTAFTFKTLLIHYAKQALTPRSLNMKLGRRRNYHKGWAAIRHYANQTARPL